MFLSSGLRISTESNSCDGFSMGPDSILADSSKYVLERNGNRCLWIEPDRDYKEKDPYGNYRIWSERGFNHLIIQIKNKGLIEHIKSFAEEYESLTRKNVKIIQEF